MGRLAFEVNFQQTQEVFIGLQDLSLKLDGEVSVPVTGTLSIVTGDETVECPGVTLPRTGFKHLKNHTSYKNTFIEGAQTSVGASLDALREATLHLEVRSGEELLGECFVSV